MLKETSPGSLGGRLDYCSASCPLVARSTLQKAAFRLLVQTRGAGAVARAVTPGIDSFARDATGLLNSHVGSVENGVDGVQGKQVNVNLR